MLHALVGCLLVLGVQDMHRGNSTHAGLPPIVSRIIYGETVDSSLDADLVYASQVDRAHVVMLAERRIIGAEPASRLLRVIDDLRARNFAPLRGRHAARGFYFLYEDHLIQVLGPQIGGILQAARSRNDLAATALRLRLRKPYLRFLTESLRLQVILLRRARRYAHVVMPIYTHYQAALPVTYGHYLLGLALALERDIRAFLDAGADLARCPLGAGAVGGTSLPIDSARTATLLGFDEPVLHSIDAVASRDLVLRLLASAATVGVTLSRLAADILLWTTAEFGFVSLPDALVGSSSMMPQKRNPILLEYLQGRSSSALGAFVAATTATHGTPFTYSVAAGQESVAHVWKALADVTDAITLARVVMAGATPQPEAMLRRAVAGYTTATALADRLMVRRNMAFRTAHHAVGEIVRIAIRDGGIPLSEAASRSLADDDLSALSLDDLDPVSVVQSSTYGGGPGSTSFEASAGVVRERLSLLEARLRELQRAWRAADERLEEAVQALHATAANAAGTEGGRS